jgi:L-aspartate oxidase
MKDRVLVIGGGVAGLAAAIRLAPLPVTVIAGAKLATGAATAWAQGGIAAAMGDDDRPELHAADTLKAGAGIGDADIARHVTAAAPGIIDWLKRLGASFDRDAAGKIALGLEAAHSRRRIVHARGDGTGRAVLEALIRAARALPTIELIEDGRANDLVLDRDGHIAGVIATRNGQRHFIPAHALILATGGIGGLYRHTTNPLGAVGGGLAIAARAGAVLRDMEFVQFHPTAIALGRDPMPLATEAIRGEGAALVNGKGERFMAEVPGAELAPRDVVARAIWRELQRGEKVFLDGSSAMGARFPMRFPSVTALCRDLGLDPATTPIPVRPAAHYHMGGIKVDERGRSSLSGLWACGEVAATGFHGANRLASNSLLEALAFADWIAADIEGRTGASAPRPVELPPSTPLTWPDPARLTAIRTLMEDGVGVARDEERLTATLGDFAGAANSEGPERDLAVVGLTIAASALSRRESRGGHFREDYPQARPERAHSSEITLAAALGMAARHAEARRPARTRR